MTARSLACLVLLIFFSGTKGRLRLEDFKLMTTRANQMKKTINSHIIDKDYEYLNGSHEKNPQVASLMITAVAILKPHELPRLQDLVKLDGLQLYYKDDKKRKPKSKQYLRSCSKRRCTNMCKEAVDNTCSDHSCGRSLKRKIKKKCRKQCRNYC